MAEDGADFELGVAEAVAPSGVRYLRGAEGYRHLDISRRTFFRWRGYGEQSGDFPPFDEPLKLEGWYNRMRDRGLFKHQFPRGVRDAIAENRQPEQVPGVVEKKSTSGPPSPRVGEGSVAAAAAGAAGGVPSSYGMDHGDEQGLLYEIAQEENRVASLRKARDEAYQKDEKEKGDAFARQYTEALDNLSTIKQRSMKILELEGRLVPREDVEGDLAPRITGIVIGGMFLYGRIAMQLEAATDPSERLAIWKRAWVEHCGPIMQSKFLPEGITRAPEEVWIEAAERVQGQVPPPLVLEAA